MNIFDRLFPAPRLTLSAILRWILRVDIVTRQASSLTLHRRSWSYDHRPSCSSRSCRSVRVHLRNVRSIKCFISTAPGVCIINQAPAVSQYHNRETQTYSQFWNNSGFENCKKIQLHFFPDNQHLLFTDNGQYTTTIGPPNNTPPP